MAEIKLLPCPFCGSTDLEWGFTFPDYVLCNSCEAMGPESSDPEGIDARLAWNHRFVSADSVDRHHPSWSEVRDSSTTPP